MLRALQDMGPAAIIPAAVYFIHLLWIVILSFLISSESSLMHSYLVQRGVLHSLLSEPVRF